MTFREAITFNDAVARLKQWKKREQRNQWAQIGVQRRRAEMWRNRAMVQSERATQAEREVRKLKAEIERLTVATATMGVTVTGSPSGTGHSERRRRPVFSPAPAALLPQPSPTLAAVPTTSGLEQPTP